MSRDDSAASIPEDPRDSVRITRARAGDPEIPRTPSTWAVLHVTEDGGSRDSRIPQKGGLSFFLQNMIAEGGVGEVWSAHQLSLDRVVAIKKIRSERGYLELPPDSARRRFIDQRFEDEAMITARLEHPNIVPVYDLGRDVDGAPMLAMKLVRGEPWSDTIHRDLEGLSADEFLARHLPLFINMMQAVAFAHSRGVIHRDLKPAQVMLGEFGEVLLVDWGLAILADEDHAREGEDPSPNLLPKPILPTPTTATNPSGTPALMAPEQTLDHAGEITRQTDIYMLGGTLYYLLTGSYPHDASTTSVSVKLAARGFVEHPHRKNPSRPMPRELVDLAMQALRPEKSERPASVSEMISRVGDYLSGSSSRRESEKLAEKVIADLASLRDSLLVVRVGEDGVHVRRLPGFIDVDSIYSTLTQCRDALDHAFGLWASNPRLPDLSDAVSAAWAVTAVETGDLRLAAHLARDIRSAGVRTTIEEAITLRREIVASQTRTRKFAVAAVIALLIIIGAGGFRYAVDQQRALTHIQNERDAAEAARQQALVQEGRANKARLDAETEQYFATIAYADTSLRQGRVEKVKQVLLNNTPRHLRNWEWGRLYSRIHPETITLFRTDKDHEALCAAWTLDGQRVLTGDRSGRLAVWDADTGRLLDHGIIHGMGLWDIVLLPDGDAVLTTSFDKTAAVVDLDTLEVRHRLRAHDNILRGAAVSPDGSLAVTTSRDDTLCAWETDTWRLRYRTHSVRGSGYAVCFTSDGQRLLVCSSSNVRLHEAYTGTLLGETLQHPENVLGVAVSPDGTRFATACTDRFLRVFDTKTLALLLEINNETSWLQSLDWSPDGQRIMTGDHEGSCRIWNAESGELISSVRTAPSLFRVAYSPDASRFVTCSAMAAQIWDADALPLADGSLRIPETEEPSPNPERIIGVYAEPLEQKGAWIGYDRLFRDDEDGLKAYDHAGRSWRVGSYYTAHSPDGNRRVSIDPGTLLPYLVTDAGEESVRRQLSEDRAFHAKWSPDGQTFTIGFVNGDFTVWDGRAERPRVTLGDSQAIADDMPARVPGTFSYSPDGKRVIAGRRNGTCEIFSARSGEPLRSLGPEDGAVFVAVFSPDGARVAAGGISARVRIWDAETGNLISTLRGHSQSILSIDFHPGEDRVLTGARDDEARLWEVATGREIMTVFAFPGPDFLLGAAFSGDGREAAAITSSAGLHVAETLPWRERDLPEVPLLNEEQRLQVAKRTASFGRSVSPDEICFTLQALDSRVASDLNP